MQHVVVAIISRQNLEGELSYFLVQSRTLFGKFTHAWYPPGGHVEHGETNEEALRREIHEELGVNMTQVRHIIDTPGDVPLKQVSWYACEIEGEIRLDTTELREGRFFTKREMGELFLWPATKKFFEKYVE